jgi:hypothetical protein
MIHRTLITLVFVLVGYVSALGQTSYRGLTPGKSTRADVEGVPGSARQQLMMRRTLSVIIFVLLICFTCFGQIQRTYNTTLVAGESTKREVERSLGPPLIKVSEVLFEYKPHWEYAKHRLYVQYEKDTFIVERFEMAFAEPHSRDWILNAYVAMGIYRAPVKPEVTAVNAKGRLEEYFSGGLVLTHESDSPTSGVIRQAFYSDRLFSVALKRPDPDSSEVEEGAESKVQPTSKGYAADSPSLDGLVQIRMANGSLKAVADATIDVYTNEPGDLYPAQTRTGAFGYFRNLSLRTGNILIVASGPGMQWTYVRYFIMGKAEVTITANPGEGTRPSKRHLIEKGILTLR